MSNVLVALLALLALLACGAPEVQVPAVGAPVVPGAVLRAPPAVELVLEPSGLWIDPRPWYATRPGDAARPIQPGRVVALAAWEPVEGSAHELALPAAAEMLRALAGDDPPPLLLRAPPEAPARMAQRVVFSAQMAGYPSVDVAVTSDGTRTHRVPLRFAPPCAAEVARGGECLYPVITAVAGGWSVTAEASSAVGDRCDPGLVVSSSAPWWRRELVTAPGTCPVAGDLPSLSAFLGAFEGRVPSCGGRVVPQADATWQAAIDAIVAVRQRGGHPDATLGVPSGREAPPCDAAFVVPTPQPR